jgi:hypothetical protein
MLDAAMLMLVAICFALAGSYVGLCHHLLRPRDTRDNTPEMRATS